MNPYIWEAMEKQRNGTLTEEERQHALRMSKINTIIEAGGALIIAGALAIGLLL